MKVQGNNEELICSCECGFVKKVKGIIFSEKGAKVAEVGEGVVKYAESDKGFPHTCLKCGYGHCDVKELDVFLEHPKHKCQFKLRWHIVLLIFKTSKDWGMFQS